MKLKRLLLIAFLLTSSLTGIAQVSGFVDPRIGSVGVGRTFPGPSMPFGMCKPGPDCGVKPNAGWAPMPEVVTGFSQTHVSGTGGGQKYGNILIQPFLRGKEQGARSKEQGAKGKEQGARGERNDYSQRRVSEDISLGYYATTFENDIRTEITTSERCAFYRIHYPQEGGLLIDATHYLGKNPVPDQREQQQFVGGEVEVVSDREVRGYSRIRGGWNNGDAYTVYFCLISDEAMDSEGQGARGKGQKAREVNFADSVVNIKIGISYVSEQQAKRNIPDYGFDTQLQRLRDSWERLLSRIKIEGTEAQKRTLYERFILREIDKVEYMERKAEIDKELRRLEQACSTLDTQTAQMQMDEDTKKASRKLAQEIVGAGGLAAGLADTLIERVYVYPGNQFDVAWKVKDFCKAESKA